ncbi:Hypothetical Protein CGB_D5190C [Cryptococcus gattii WM276]|uniref:Uncharacterized protein n=1 Tax=Cryptococcus gattii serotype B (strain WM276 / ATCC MYA-4071) TaxID=367775 RepID=E6R434_CRYGW|nr:Hypothetical Protein CGB_D5190C [Cryptococcus gattii WM276]ADV21909.1 Hypothetical Protein CGB_D5190C [Cryptococcus gattii WM276]
MLLVPFKSITQRSPPQSSSAPRRHKEWGFRVVAYPFSSFSVLPPRRRKTKDEPDASMIRHHKRQHYELLEEEVSGLYCTSTVLVPFYYHSSSSAEPSLLNDQYSGDNQSSALQYHQPRTRYEEGDTATIEHALDAGKRLLEAGGSTYLPFTVRTARDIYSQIFQQDDSSGGDDGTNFNPGELHRYLDSLDPAAYAEASQASLELLAMGPQLKALDKRFEGELSQVLADILLQHSTSSSFRSKGNADGILSNENAGVSAKELYLLGRLEWDESIQGGSLLSEEGRSTELIPYSKALLKPLIELSNRTASEEMGTNPSIMSPQDSRMYPVSGWSEVDNRRFQSLRDLYLTRVSRNGTTYRPEKEYRPAGLITADELSQYDGSIIDIATSEPEIHYPRRDTAPAESKLSIILSRQATVDFHRFILQGGDIGETCRRMLEGGGDGYDVQDIATDGTARHEHGHASGFTNDGKSLVSVTYSRKTFGQLY